MKLLLKGHDERYVVEQGMLNLFPGERPVYGPIEGEDSSWAVVELEEAGDTCRVNTKLCVEGKRGEHTLTAELSGDDYHREGQRRRAIGKCFFFAARAVTGITPPWGMLTGVRPVKLPTRAMLSGKSPEEARRQLEEEYLVSPRRAALALDCAVQSLRASESLGRDEVSLYVGIPFCPTRCAYCSFISADVTRSLQLLEPFLACLLREIAATGEALRRSGRFVRTIYIGGGTPTTLSASQLSALMGALEEHLDLSHLTEYTVEAGRPDTITAEKMAALKAGGAGRVSVNPQAMEDHVLRAIGRSHTAADIERAMDTVRAAGLEIVNMDLIAGLPGDSASGFRSSLDRVMAMGPENITVHTLALKKGSRLMTETAEHSGEGAVEEMLSYSDEALRRAGYAPYYLYRQKYMSGSFENVGWARPGTENLYNIAMMEELHTVVALGGGGVTKLVDSGRIRRIANAKYPYEYINTIDTCIAGKEALFTQP